ncbi:MAG: hypothetical protein U5R46_16500 [Gammaproteobacteria bacterium]|nr:hypothetical protein [Gammaproteobacteria bacterium]
MRRFIVGRGSAAAFLFLGGALAQGVPGMAAAQDCDCSCEVFASFRERMQEFSDAAGSGEAVVMPPELQQVAVCGGQCAMQWAQCGSPGTAAVPAVPVQEPADSAGGSGAEASASGGDAVAPSDESYPLGEPRDDLERFHGVYGDGASNRNFFVTAAEPPRYSEQEIPPGYLMIGAMWGDVAPWYMKSLSETRFEQQWVNPGGEPITAVFEVDGDGKARALVFETVFADRGRLERVGDLPEGW